MGRGCLIWMRNSGGSQGQPKKFMLVAENFKYAPNAYLDVAPKALYLLSSPSTPEAARESTKTKWLAISKS